MVHLDLRTLLPLTRAAFNAGQLQAQTQIDVAGRGCRYDGPCAIGVGLTAEEQKQLDDPRTPDGWEPDTSIDDLISCHLVSVPDDQRSDFVRLQKAHDDVLLHGATLADFETTLIELEAKYVS